MQIRMTQQTKLVLATVKKFGHATNSTILIYADKKMPGLSATTVHRITNRLITNGFLSRGPYINNSTVIDANIKPHDHFVCYKCGGVKDIYLPVSIRKSLQKQVPGFEGSTQLTISGDCVKCLSHS